MLAPASPVMVRPCTSKLDYERRIAERHTCILDATTRTLDTQDTLAWGALVRDISVTGIGLTLCFPFRAGTYLALDLHGPNSENPAKTVLAKVVQVRDQHDGSWQIGCEFVKPLEPSELEFMI